MTKAGVLKYPEGSAERVVAHAKWRASRRKRPASVYPNAGEENPREALRFAKEDIAFGEKCDEITALCDRELAKLREVE